MDFCLPSISATPSLVSGPNSKRISTMILLTLVLLALIEKSLVECTYEGF